MKIRSDFVTNSSSSSFILGFKSEKDIEKTLRQDKCYEYFERIYDDCVEADKMDMNQMLAIAREEIEWNVKFDVKYYSDKARSMSWEEVNKWTKTEEFEEMVEEEIQRRLNEMKIKSEEQGDQVFVDIRYEDRTLSDSELEHEIVPNLKCCIRRFSHH